MSTDQVRELESRHVVQTYRRTPIVLVRGKGVRVFDADGREYLDLLASARSATATKASRGRSRNSRWK